jgi:4-amino-4-deoxy-L-arabinose transferase-like glycosyltransferase
MNNISTKWYWSLFALITIVHLLGMGLIDIMDVDAAQYASMSREMLETGNYLQLYNRGIEYLDKPPFLFWVTTASFKLFGISNFTYKLPSFLFVLIGVFSTYKLGKLLYTKNTGWLASIILYSSQAYFLFVHDVRTDTILANVVILAVWQLYVFMNIRSLQALIIGAIAVGIAMLEKGPIGVMVPVLALGSQIVYARNWKVIWRWEWLLGLVVLLIVLAPMCYGLYTQYGMHGLEFYFWTQSFGRITGQSEWQDNSSIFYFVHTFLWAFLPWMFIAFYGVGMNLFSILKDKLMYKNGREVVTTAGFVLTFIAMSLSNYKLPHYIFVAFPLVAIITANHLISIAESNILSKIFIGLNWFAMVALSIVAALLVFGTFTLSNPVVIFVGFGLMISGFYYLIKGKNSLQKVFVSPALLIIGINFLLNTFFYPTLLQYQGGSVIGKEINKKYAKDTPVYSYNIMEHSMDFYARRTVPVLGEKEALPADEIYIFTNATGYSKLQDRGFKIDVLKEVDDYHVTELTIHFLRPSLRPNIVGKNYLLRVSK